MPTSIWDHPIATIEKALDIRKKIEALQASLLAIYGNGKQPSFSEKPAPVTKDGRKGKRSAATIAKMKAAAKARWAGRKNAVPAPAETVVKTKKKRTFSAASRAKMAAAQKARWAKKKIDADVTMPNKLVW